MFLVNGAGKHCIDVTDRGLQYGDGLFETLEVVQGKPLLFDLHLQRLLAGCSKLLIPQPNLELLTAEALAICSDAEHAVLKIIITRGCGGRGYRQPDPVMPTRLLSLHPYPQYPDRFYHEGIVARFCQHPLSINPLLAGIKHLNRLDQVLARAEWQDDAVQEGLMLDCEGYLVEGTMSNLFWIKHHTVYTPAIERAGINGILRQWLLTYLDRAGINVVIERFLPESLLAADQVFVTNSVIGIWPVRQLNDQLFSVGPLIRQLQAAYQAVRCGAQR